MMQEAAIPLGIDLRALVEAADGSAGQAVPHSRVGQASDVGAVEDLARQVDVLTVEHEHVPDAVLRAAERIVPVRPGAHALAFAPDDADSELPEWTSGRQVRERAPRRALVPHVVGPGPFALGVRSVLMVPERVVPRV